MCNTKVSSDTGACIAIVSISSDVITLRNVWDNFEAGRFGLALPHQYPCFVLVHQPPVGRGRIMQPTATPFESRGGSVSDEKVNARDRQRRQAHSYATSVV